MGAAAQGQEEQPDPAVLGSVHVQQQRRRGGGEAELSEAVLSRGRSGRDRRVEARVQQQEARCRQLGQLKRQTLDWPLPQHDAGFALTPRSSRGKGQPSPGEALPLTREGVLSP